MLLLLIGTILLAAIGVATVAVADAVTVDGVFGVVPGVPDSSMGEPGDASGSAKSSNPLGVGSLFNSSLNSL